jgi:hypothetical protein
VLPGRGAHLKEKIAKVKQQMQTLEVIGQQIKACEDAGSGLQPESSCQDHRRRSADRCDEGVGR